MEESKIDVSASTPDPKKLDKSGISSSCADKSKIGDVSGMSSFIGQSYLSSDSSEDS